MLPRSVTAHCIQNLVRHRSVHSQTAKRNAAIFPPLLVGANALIVDHRRSCPDIRDLQHSTATPAPQKARKQSAAAAAGLWLQTGLHMVVGVHHRLIAFILLP